MCASPLPPFLPPPHLSHHTYLTSLTSLTTLPHHPPSPPSLTTLPHLLPSPPSLTSLTSLTSFPHLPPSPPFLTFPPPSLTPLLNSPAEGGSPEFSRFLELLGDEVVMDGWEHFRGGLDTKSKSHALERLNAYTPSHSHIFTLSLLTLTSSHSHILSLSHPHTHILTSSHSHIVTSSHILTSHPHSHIVTHPHFTSSLHILTSHPHTSSLHILTSHPHFTSTHTHSPLSSQQTQRAPIQCTPYLRVMKSCSMFPLSSPTPAATNSRYRHVHYIILHIW